MKAAMMVAALAGVLAQGGCAISCGATSDRLAALRRGMPYGEASAVMGCPGTVLTRGTSASGEFAVVEWSGPDSPIVSRTQIDFFDGRLLSYTTGRRGAL